jgi:DNA-directed RNA polymerase subunit beta'
MAKPKNLTAGGGEIIENPILSNFKKVFFYWVFYFTHGARKVLRIRFENGGCRYLTRRPWCFQDIVNIEDCGTLRGVEVSALKRMKKWLSLRKESWRVVLQDVINPLTNEG